MLKWSFGNDYELSLPCTAVICSESQCTVEDSLTDFFLVDQSKFKLTNQNSGSKNKSKLHVCVINEPEPEEKRADAVFFFPFLLLSIFSRCSSSRRVRPQLFTLLFFRPDPNNVNNNKKIIWTLKNRVV